MKPQIRLATGAAALAASGGMVLGASGAPARTTTGTAAQVQQVSHRGVGQVHIGMRFSKARALGLVGPRQDGCPVDTSDAANLRAPLEGFVDVSRGTPRRITRITVRGGATARGVRVGDPLSKVKRKFPGAKVVNVPEFGGLTFARVSKSAGGKFDFILGNGPKQRVKSMEIRRFAVCD